MGGLHDIELDDVCPQLALSITSLLTKVNKARVNAPSFCSTGVSHPAVVNAYGAVRLTDLGRF